jgi:hypothetical protein
MDLINTDQTTSNEFHLTMSSIKNDTYWIMSNTELSRIDLFKGIVPKALYNHLLKLLHQESKVYAVITLLYDMITDRFKKEIWNPSRERLHTCINVNIMLIIIELCADLCCLRKSMRLVLYVSYFLSLRRTINCIM